MIAQPCYAFPARASVGRSPVMADRRWPRIAAVLVCMASIVSEVLPLGAVGSNATTGLWNLETSKRIRSRDTEVIFEDVDSERHQSKRPLDWPLLVGIVITILLLLLLCVLVFRLPTSQPKYTRLHPVRDWKNPVETFTYIDISNEDYHYPGMPGWTHNSVPCGQHHCSNSRFAVKFENEKSTDSNMVDVPAAVSSSARGDTSAQETRAADRNKQQAGHRHHTDRHHAYFDRNGRQIYRISSTETIDSPTGEESSYKRLRPADSPETLDTTIIRSSRETLLHASSASGVAICRQQVIPEAKTRRPPDPAMLASAAPNSVGTSPSHGSSSVTSEAETPQTQLEKVQSSAAHLQLVADDPLTSLRPPKFIMVLPYNPISTCSTYSSGQRYAQESTSEETFVQIVGGISSEQVSMPATTEELTGKTRVRRETPMPYSASVTTPESDAPALGKRAVTPAQEQARLTSRSPLYVTRTVSHEETSTEERPGASALASRKDSRGEDIVCQDEIPEEIRRDRTQSVEGVLDQTMEDQVKPTSLLFHHRSDTVTAAIPHEPKSSPSAPTAQMNAKNVQGHIEGSSEFPPRVYKPRSVAPNEWCPKALDARTSGSKELSVPVTERVAYFDGKHTAPKQAAPDTLINGTPGEPDASYERQLPSPAKAPHRKTEQWIDESPPGSISGKPVWEFITPGKLPKEKLVLPIPPIRATSESQSPLRARDEQLNLTCGITFGRKTDKHGSTEPFSLDDTTATKASPSAETFAPASTTRDVFIQQLNTEIGTKQLTPPSTSPRSKTSFLRTLEKGVDTEVNHLSFEERPSIEYFPQGRTLATPIAAKRTSVPDTKRDQAEASGKQPAHATIQHDSDIQGQLVELQHANVTPCLQSGEVTPRETAGSVELPESYELVEYPSPSRRSLEVHPVFPITARDGTALRTLPVPGPVEEVPQHQRQIMDVSSTVSEELESSVTPTNLQSIASGTSIPDESTSKPTAILTRPNFLSEELPSSEEYQKLSALAKQDEPVPIGRKRSGDNSWELLPEDQDNSIVLRGPLRIAESPSPMLQYPMFSTAPPEKDDSVNVLQELQSAEQQLLPCTEGIELPFRAPKHSSPERYLVPVTEQIILPTERTLLYPAIEAVQEAKIVHETVEATSNFGNETGLDKSEGQQMQVKSAGSPEEDHADELAVVEQDVTEGSTAPTLPAQLEGLLSDIALTITESKEIPREIAVSESISQLVKSIHEITSRRDGISAQEEEAKLEWSVTKASDSMSSALKNLDVTEEERPSIQEEERPALTLLYRPSIEYLPLVSIDGSSSSEVVKETRNETQNSTSTWSHMNFPKGLINQYHSPGLLSRSTVALSRLPGRGIDHAMVAASEVAEPSSGNAIVPVSPADGTLFPGGPMSPSKGANQIRQDVVEFPTESTSGKTRASDVSGFYDGTNPEYQATSSVEAPGGNMLSTTEVEARPPSDDAVQSSEHSNLMSSTAIQSLEASAEPSTGGTDFDINKE
ncbi:uncharacterized protein LOC135383326 [Ornithodoros turicata]|uniref:uncharacterized protein LOC135383326 n=1 Tax=Ornithodoros turicata TaxID=34597 RepID=UPI003139CC0B